MVFQLLAGFIYSLVEQSWLMATILVKYFLLALGVKIVSEQRFEPEYIFEELTRYSGEIISVIVLLGLVNVFAGIEIDPLFNTFSQVTAFLYFLLLFWEY